MIPVNGASAEDGPAQTANPGSITAIAADENELDILGVVKVDFLVLVMIVGHLQSNANATCTILVEVLSRYLQIEICCSVCT